MQPATNAVTIDVSAEISCEFDEQMNRMSVLRALTIVPPFEQEPQYVWKGTLLRIVPMEPLQDNRTYVVTIGTDATDLRNNRLPASITWAFSTGDRVDQGSLAGRVYGAEELIATWISAYPAGEMASMDFSAVEPLYQVQTDEKGRFQLEYVADGRYRIVAWRDMNHDQKFTPRSDPLALSPWDVHFTKDQPDHSALLLMLASRDTLPASARRAADAAPLGLTIQFDKPLHPAAGDSLIWQVRNAGDEVVDVSQWKIVYMPEQPEALTVFPDEPLAPGDFTMTVANAANIRGIRSVLREDTLKFRITEKLPEDLPMISKVSPAPDSRTVIPAAKVTMTFNTMMRPVNTESIVILQDSTGTIVATTRLWPDGETLHITPREWLVGGTTYNVQVDTIQLQDWYGRALADTMTAWTFTVADQDFGAVAGRVTDAGHSGTAPIVLQLRNPETSHVLSEQKLTQPGPFRFSNVIAGSYQLVAFCDEDNNGRISTGLLVPYMPAELFVIADELIDVRAGWDVEDVLLEFPQ
jgi:hypothetical protein